MIPEIDPLLGPLPDRLRSFTLSQLRPGEKLLWVGQPVASSMALRSVIMPGCAFVFALGCFGLWRLLCWLLGWFSSEPILLAVISWIAAALLSLFFLVLLILPYQAWWRAKRTGYFVSNQRAFVVVAIGSGEIFAYPQGYFASNHRALVVLASGSGEIFSYEPAALDEIFIHELADGSGEILLEYHLYFVENRSTSSDGEFSTNSVRRVEKVVGFLELQQIDPPKRALETLLGRELLAERVIAHSLNYEHPL